LIAAAGMVNKQFLMSPRWGGSPKKRLPNVDRDREASHLRLYKQYFDPVNPIFKEKAFGRRYRMSRELFLVISMAWGITMTISRLATIPVRFASLLTKNVLRPFSSLHMEYQG
jgi:hypothetical protein